MFTRALAVGLVLLFALGPFRALAQDTAQPSEAASTPETSEPSTDRAVVPPPPSGEPTPDTSDEAAVETETAEDDDEDDDAAAATPAPAPASIPLEAVVAGVPIRLYGILHASVIGTQGVQSFGQPNASAATSALNPALSPRPDDPALTFQVQQTRLGLTVGDEHSFRGQVEIDFIHFDNSSPTTQAFPRLRIGLLEWQFAENQRFFLGQTWDIFGNATTSLLSHSSNLVGTLFQAGNIGFMRPQLGWSGRFGIVETAIAVGLQAANITNAFNNIEESFTPTGSARVMVHVGDAPTSVIGIGGLGTALRFLNGMAEQRRLALGGDLFADLTFGPVNVHAELYIAQNLANLGALNLGQGRLDHDVADVGGYLSGRLNLGEHSITAMVGGAGVLQPSEVIPGYTVATPGMTGGVGTVATANGPGMIYNVTAHVAYWYSPLHGLSIVFEPYLYFTRFVYAPEDQGRFAPDRLSFGGQLVGMYQF